MRKRINANKNMKKLIFLTMVSLFITTSVSAQMGMMGRFFNGVDDHTKKEEAEGKQIWQKLQKKEIDCQKLTDSQFEALGEYFMGAMMGESHVGINQMMRRMMGEKGEKEVHMVMGKRMSGCQPQAVYSTGWGWMMPFGGMMSGWMGGFFGWWLMIVPILVLVILVLLIIYLWKKIRK